MMMKKKASLTVGKPSVDDGKPASGYSVEKQRSLAWWSDKTSKIEW